MNIVCEFFAMCKKRNLNRRIMLCRFKEDERYLDDTVYSCSYATHSGKAVKCLKESDMVRMMLGKKP